MSFIGVALLPRKNQRSLLGILGFFSNMRHQQQGLACKPVQCCSECYWLLGKKVRRFLHCPQLSPEDGFLQMRDLKAVSIWFRPQQPIYAINCIQLLLPPLKREQLRNRKKIRSYPDQAAVELTHFRAKRAVVGIMEPSTLVPGTAFTTTCISGMKHKFLSALL